MEELLNIMKAAHKDGFRSFGIRSINTRISGRANVGDILPKSYDWGYGTGLQHIRHYWRNTSWNLCNLG